MRLPPASFLIARSFRRPRTSTRRSCSKPSAPRASTSVQVRICRMKTILALCCALLMTAPVLVAQDVEGCKDSPMITRMAGSKINSCDHKEFDQVTFGMPADAQGNEQKVVEGEVSTWDYYTRDDMSELQVYRNMQTALKRAG